MTHGLEFREDGTIYRNYQQIGYIKDDVVYSGGNRTWGGQQVGYVKDGLIYTGGNGTWGGHQAGKAAYPHPRWNAAIYFLLT